MPEELSPGFSSCATCGRVVETKHANTAGRCSDCAGKTADQLEEAAAQPVGNVMAADGGVLVESDPTPMPTVEEQHER